MELIQSDFNSKKSFLENPIFQTLFDNLRILFEIINTNSPKFRTTMTVFADRIENIAETIRKFAEIRKEFAFILFFRFKN